jgi:lysozyme family protein
MEVKVMRNTLKTPPATDKYRKNYDRIFKKQHTREEWRRFLLATEDIINIEHKKSWEKFKKRTDIFGDKISGVSPMSKGN